MRAIYPGRIDPTTNGHLDIIRRAAKISDTPIVSILDNPQKAPLFTVEERKRQLESITKDIDNVEIHTFSGLLVDFVNQMEADVIIRGLRAMTDFEYEFQMALTNRALSENVETLFIPTSLNYLFLSSSIVKEVSMLDGDYKELVPEVVYKDLEKKFRGKS